MNKQLHLIRKAVRLNCVWKPTGDAKKPLACVWVETGAPCALAAAPADSEAGGLRLCA